MWIVIAIDIATLRLPGLHHVLYEAKSTKDVTATRVCRLAKPVICTANHFVSGMILLSHALMSTYPLTRYIRINIIHDPPDILNA